MPHNTLLCHDVKAQTAVLTPTKPMAAQGKLGQEHGRGFDWLCIEISVSVWSCRTKRVRKGPKEFSYPFSFGTIAERVHRQEAMDHIICLTINNGRPYK